MNTKERLFEDLGNTKEVLLEERFAALYEEEIAEILARKEDLKKIENLEEEKAKEIEEAARLYNRAFARNFYDVSKGRVSDEEFFSLWEREDELMAGLQTMQSLEGEKKQLEKELDIVTREEGELYEKIKEAKQERQNKQVIFRSFVCMAVTAAILAVIAVVYFELPVRTFVWQIAAVVIVVLLCLTILFQNKKKAMEAEKFCRMMSGHKHSSRTRLESDYQDIASDLKFYYEKFEVLFSYISEEQWNLFEFCTQISARLRLCEDMKESGDHLVTLLKECGLERAESWLYYPKALFDVPKMISCRERLDNRENVCRQALIRHEREMEKVKNKIDI